MSFVERSTYSPHRSPVSGSTMPGPASARFALLHLWLPLLAFIVLAGLLSLGNVDSWWADRLYAWQGHRWALKSRFVTEQLIHHVGRDASALAWLGVVLTWFFARSRPRLTHWRRPLAYLALSVLLATTLVAWFKSWSNMDCPWDLLRYGGERPYIGLLHLRPVGLSRGACFPAGHASAGYAWVALYFFFLVARPQWRWRGLSAGIGSGLLFGLSQQLRGAHFLSHDVWAAAICWMTALGVYRLFYRHEIPRVIPDREIRATPPQCAIETATDREAWAVP
jgi:membrane-associated PAP2 superfamily phosphatase